MRNLKIDWKTMEDSFPLQPIGFHIPEINSSGPIPLVWEPQLLEPQERPLELPNDGSDDPRRPRPLQLRTHRPLDEEREHQEDWVQLLAPLGRTPRAKASFEEV